MSVIFFIVAHCHLPHFYRRLRPTLSLIKPTQLLNLKDVLPFAPVSILLSISCMIWPVCCSPSLRSLGSCSSRELLLLHLILIFWRLPRRRVRLNNLETDLFLTWPFVLTRSYPCFPCAIHVLLTSVRGLVNVGGNRKVEEIREKEEGTVYDCRSQKASDKMNEERIRANVASSQLEDVVSDSMVGQIDGGWRRRMFMVGYLDEEREES